METDAVPIYIVNGNYLASEYIQSLLTEEGLTNAKAVPIVELDQRKALDSSSSLVLVDQVSIAAALIPIGQKLRICFPASRLIIIGKKGFGQRLWRLFPSWVFDVVEYTNIKELPEVVHQGLEFLSGEKAAGASPMSVTPFLFQHPNISQRELEILELLCLRLSNKEIANQLDIAVATVKFHVSNIYAKLKVRRRRELLTKAGIVPPHIHPGVASSGALKPSPSSAWVA